MSNTDHTTRHTEQMLIELNAGVARMNSLHAVAKSLAKGGLGPDFLGRDIQYIFRLFADECADAANTMDLARETIEDQEPAV